MHTVNTRNYPRLSELVVGLHVVSTHNCMLCLCMFSLCYT